jgi:ligand-binding sensor domain-containing protein
MKQTLLFYGILTVILSIASSCEKNDKTIAVKGLMVTPNSLVLDMGHSSSLTASISPQNASDQSLLWSSNDPTIADVSSSGLVTATGPGVVTIKATSKDGGLSSACIVTVTKSTTYTTKNSGLTNDSILSIGIDKNGNKWFGTLNGVSRFDGSVWTGFNSSNSNLLSDKVFSIACDNEGNKWFAIEKGISEFDDITWITYDTLNSGLAGYPVNTIILDSQGNKWIGTGKGISKFDGINWTTYNSSNVMLADNTVGSIAIDIHGNIWFGNLAGASKFDGTNWSWYMKGDALAGFGVNAIVQDKNGNIWFGTSDGLSKFNGTSWTSYFPNIQINALAVDEKGALWVALTYQMVNDVRTSAGVAKFDGETWTTFNKTNSGLIDNTVRSIVVDNNNHKWIGTMGGITEIQDEPGK